MAPFYANELYLINFIQKGYVPPESFVYLDRLKIIQKDNGIPILYHTFRRANVKAIQINHINENNLRFDTSISNKDLGDVAKLNIKQFWWLSNV